VSAVLFAVLSGLSWGAADFSGALATKENNAFLVTFGVQLVSLASLAVVIVVLGTGTVLGTDLAWGAVGGLGGSIGLVTFYKALARGPMSVAASVTALVSSLVPVMTGLALGEVPGTLALIGAALAIPATVLVSVGGMSLGSIYASPRDRVASRSGAGQTRLLAVIAGLGFGLFYIALSRTSVDSGLFPLIGARGASIALLAIALSTTRAWAMPKRSHWPHLAVAGVLDCAANSFYLFALETGNFTWVAAISSLYPVSTVLLARLVLGERIKRLQLGGLALAVLALVMVSLGR
jgi:uncharacterized membrane protein